MTNSFGYLPKSHKILWIALRVVILAWGVYGLFHGSVVEFLEAIFAIIFTHLWDFFQIFGKKSFKEEVPKKVTPVKIDRIKEDSLKTVQLKLDSVKNDSLQKAIVPVKKWSSKKHSKSKWKK